MKTNHPDTNGGSSGEQPLLAVGQWLKEAREQKGESLDDAAKITRIGKNYLEALEEGATVKLPSQAYTRGFVRLYAAHLGLSPDEAVSMMTGHGAEITQADQQEKLSSPGHCLPSDRHQAGAAKTKKLLFSIICAAALATIFFTLRYKPDHIDSSPAPGSGTSATPLSGPALVAAGTEKQPSPPAAIPLQGAATEATTEVGLVLRLKAVTNGRLHITIDGSISQEYDLVTGDIVEWKAEKVLLLDLENAGSVEGELGGTPLKPFGEAGKAAHLIIRPDGVQHN